VSTNLSILVEHITILSANIDGGVITLASRILGISYLDIDTELASAREERRDIGATSDWRVFTLKLVVAG